MTPLESGGEVTGGVVMMGTGDEGESRGGGGETSLEPWRSRFN